MDITTTYWTSDQTLINFGDYAGHELLKVMGHNVQLWQGWQGWPVLLTCGSMIGEAWQRNLRGARVHCWGTGTDGSHPRALPNWSASAVRGPRSTEFFPGVPQGDPALLFPKYVPLTKDQGHHEVLFIPHYFDTDRGKQLMEVVDCEGVQPTKITREMFWPMVQRIVNAHIVLTNSLHAAIFAQAYKVPWAFCVPQGATWDKPIKWLDWFDYLDVPLYVAKDVGDAIHWYEETNLHRFQPDLLVLEKAFPTQL